MNYSVGLPTCMEGMMYPVPFVTPDQLVELAQHAEKLGYHSVWGNDHMTTQRYVREEFDTPPNFWEPLISYAYLAAETTTLRFGTGILVTPMRRDIVVVAKQLATLDHFSKGRLLVGIGVGAYREEFEALQPRPEKKVHRGDMVEESIKALRALFDMRVSSWDGEYYQYEDVEMFPKPHQNPLPVYVGGNNPNAVRRAAMYGQGWLPAGMPVDQLQAHVANLGRIAAEHGRDGTKIDIAPQLITYIGRTHEDAVNKFRQSQIYNHLVSLRASTLKDQADIAFEDANLIGSAAEIVEKVKALQAAGVTHLCGTYFAANTLEELKEQMTIFAEEVIPHIS